MKFIGLLLVALALFGNLKAYKNVLFLSKKKKAENEQKFEEAMEQMDKTPVGQKMTKGIAHSTYYLTVFFNFLFYLITSVVVNNPIMYGLAVVILVLNSFGIKQSIKSFETKKLHVSKANKMSIPLKTAYIIGFFILFFL